MLSRFSFYDFITVIMPGIFFLWAVVTVTGLPLLQKMVRISGGLTESSVLIVVGYITGLMLHGVSGRITEKVLLWRWGGFPSARWLLPMDSTFSPAYRAELASNLRDRFGIDLVRGDEPKAETLKRNQEIFYRCYRALEKLSDQPQTFVAQYGLYRSLLTVFVLLSVISAWSYITQYHWRLASDGAFFLAASVSGTIVSSWQVKKRGEDFARSVYDGFLSNFPGTSGREAR